MNLSLKGKLLERGYSQIRLARDLGLSESCVSRIVNDWVIPTPEIKAKLADALDCRVEELFDFEERKKRDG